MRPLWELIQSRIFSLLSTRIHQAKRMEENANILDPDETAPEGYADEEEYFFDCSQQSYTKVTVSNIYGGGSPILVEVRDGGCAGDLKSRFTIEPGDKINLYQTLGDHVRLSATDPSAKIRYTYKIMFDFNDIETEDEISFSSKSVQSASCKIHNNRGGEAPVFVKLKLDEEPIFDFDVPASVVSSFTNRGNLIVVKATGDGTKRFTYYTAFTSD